MLKYKQNLSEEELLIIYNNLKEQELHRLEKKRKYYKEYRKNNEEKFKRYYAKQREIYLKNIEKIKEYYKNYYKINKNKICELSKKHHQENREWRLEYMKIYSKNRAIRKSNERWLHRKNEYKPKPVYSIWDEYEVG